MNEELQARTEKWMSLERRTLKQRQAAEEYYQKKLMDLISEDYVERNRENVYEKVQYLVVSVGTSYEPVVLNIRLLNPEKILFLYTEKSAFTLNQIVSMCNIQADKYDKSSLYRWKAG